jgi:hypothetical protein
MELHIWCVVIGAGTGALLQSLLWYSSWLAFELQIAQLQICHLVLLTPVGSADNKRQPRNTQYPI